MVDLSQPAGLLFDVDGVLHVSMRPVPGADATLRWLTAHGYRFCFVTNTTTMTRETLTHRLQQLGLPVSVAQVLTAPVATANYIRQYFPEKRCWVLTKGDTAEDFAGLHLVKEGAADVVVIGGAEELLSYEAMNHAFRLLMDGAVLLAMHTNLYWRTSAGLQLDSGPFVRALELASGKQATVLGKPNAAFFQQALRLLDLPASEVLMIGDDLENDVQGAQQAGLRGAFVVTGKHSADSPLLSRIHPEVILPSIVDLPAYLSSLS
ncbi:MAG TPA: TIGR01458 family HAD-type hydrolase [Ktedonobacteraceae bacterium]